MIRTLLTSLALTTALIAGGKATELSKVSEAFGHLISKNLDTIGVELELELVVKGLQDAAKGKDSPLTESECIELLSAAQEKAFQKKADENLAAAEKFLKKNASEKNIISLEEGKVQYRIEKQGEGHAVNEGASPAIKYVGKYLDGSIFGQSDEEQVISLKETILGFTKGLVGMKEGEKRTLYVHPDCGYGTSGYLQPNSLLKFEIEVVKADTTSETFNDALILDGGAEMQSSDHIDSTQVR